MDQSAIYIEYFSVTSRLGYCINCVENKLFTLEALKGFKSVLNLVVLIGLYTYNAQAVYASV